MLAGNRAISFNWIYGCKLQYSLKSFCVESREFGGWFLSRKIKLIESGEKPCICGRLSINCFSVFRKSCVALLAVYSKSFY